MRTRAIPSLPLRFDDGRAAGLTQWRMRAGDLARPFHGVRDAVGGDPVLAFALLMHPGERFSHTTAARLWGAPLPAGADALVHVTATGGRNRHRGVGVVGHRSRDGAAVLRGPVPVSTPAALVRELAPLLGLDALVAVVDFLVLDPRIPDPADPRPYATLDGIAAAVGAASTRGVRRAREAVVLARPGVESPKETEVRLLLGRAGFPPPSCGERVLDRRGRLIGWFDLVWPRQRVIVEYDGDWHRTSTAQYDKDITRFDRAVAAGWRVVRVRASGLGSTRGRAETVARVREAFAAS